LAQQLNVQLATARNYASSLLSTWQLGHCGEAVLVFCSHDDAIVGSSYNNDASYCWWI